MARSIGFLRRGFAAARARVALQERHPLDDRLERLVQDFELLAHALLGGGRRAVQRAQVLAERPRQIRDGFRAGEVARAVAARSREGAACLQAVLNGVTQAIERGTIDRAPSRFTR